MAPSPPPLPLGDPQFWIVTLAALCALAWLGRRLVPIVLRSRRHKGASTRATLTVGGQPVENKPKRDCH